MADWLADHAGKGTRIGYDPWLHTRQWVEEATQALAESGATLVAVESNPIDAVWADRPQPSDAKLTVQPDVPAGKSSAQKRQEIADSSEGRSGGKEGVSTCRSRWALYQSQKKKIR